MKPWYWLKYNTASLLLLGLLWAGAIEQWPIIFRSTALFLLIILLSLKLGKRILGTKRWTAQLCAGVTAIIALLMLALTAIYAAWQLSSTLSLGVLSVITLGVALFVKQTPTTKPLLTSLRSAIRDYQSLVVQTVICALAAGLLYHLYTSGTLGSIRTPWNFVDQRLFFGGLSLALLISYLAAWGKSVSLKPVALMAIFLVMLSAGLLIFKVGYGFDPFVHRATEHHIFQHGLITPKPLWYLGQHTLVVALAHISGLGINLIDKLLLPTLAALLLPGWLYAIAPQSWHKRLLLFAMLPIMSWFVATTPQGIANLLYLILVLQLPLLYKKQLPLWVVLTTAAATATLHPVATAAAALLLILSELSGSNLSKRVQTAGMGALSLLLPTLFLINEWRASNSLPSLAELGSRAAKRLSLPNELSFLTDSYYGLSNGIYTLRILAIALALAFTFYGIKELRKRPLFSPYLSATAALLISAAFLYLFNLQPLVISYEQSDYALRTVWLAAITALPFFWFGGLSFLKLIADRHHKAIQLLTIAALVAATTANAYLLFPRVDKLVNYKGYSTGLSDLTAVEFIENQNSRAGNNYAVLANQSVSAAALTQLGFSRELTIDGRPAYFYPIPTGGKLYGYFLQMVDEGPTKKVADQVIADADLDRVYLVLNNYWWRDYRLVTEAKKTADWWTTIDGGAINIFAWQHASSTQGWIVPGL